MSPLPTSPTASTEAAPAHTPSAPDAEPAQDANSVDSDGEDSADSGEVSGSDSGALEDKSAGAEGAPPLPSEAAPGGPPLPNEPLPTPADDGWDCQWDQSTQAWYFHNRFTGKSQWDNPRVQTETAENAAPALTTAPGVPQPPASEAPPAAGYNPAIHGDYDPNAWYAKGTAEEDIEIQAAPGTVAAADPAAMYGATATFNRFTGQFQTSEQGPERHNDEAKSKRQMNAFFDVDAAANSHDGRSLKAERSNKKPSKAELKAFKEKRRSRKEEKRRAWLLD